MIQLKQTVESLNTFLVKPSFYMNRPSFSYLFLAAWNRRDVLFFSNSGKRRIGEESSNVLKKLKSDASLEHPAFYYSIHRHSIRGMNMPK